MKYNERSKSEKIIDSIVSTRIRCYLSISLDMQIIRGRGWYTISLPREKYDGKVSVYLRKSQIKRNDVGDKSKLKYGIYKLRYTKVEYICEKTYLLECNLLNIRMVKRLFPIVILLVIVIQVVMRIYDHIMRAG